MDLMSPTDAVFLMTESREHPSGPFEFEAIAVRIGEVEITLHSECGDDLAAGLLDRWKLDTSKESPHRRGQTSFSGVVRDLICGSEGDSTAALAGTMRTVMAARCPDGGSSPTAHWWAGLGGGRRTQGAVQRAADAGRSAATGADGSASGRKQRERRGARR